MTAWRFASPGNSDRTVAVVAPEDIPRGQLYVAYDADPDSLGRDIDTEERVYTDAVIP